MHDSSSQETAPQAPRSPAAAGRVLRWLRVPMALAFGTLLALVAGEASIRVLGLGPPPRGANKTLRIVCKPVGEDVAPGVGRALVPNAEERHVYAGAAGEPDREVVYRINNLGLRGDDTTRAKADGTYRICALGDSFTFGTAVSAEETWPAALERELNADRAGSRVEVLNCGIEAINLPQEVALLENRVMRLEPDLVVLCVYLNDASGRGIEGNSALSPDTIRRRDLIARLGLTSGVWEKGEERTDAQRRTMALRRRSELVDWAAQRAYLKLYAPISASNYHSDWSPGSPGWVAAERALARAKALSSQAGFELVATMYPVLTGLERDYPYAEEHARVAAACQSLDIDFIDIVEPLADLVADGSSGDLHAHAHDAHPNARANARVGAHLAQALSPRVH